MAIMEWWVQCTGCHRQVCGCLAMCCIHRVNQVNSHDGLLWWQHYKHCPCYSLSNALHSSIGENIKSHAVSGLRPECEKLQMAITQQRVIRSPSRLVLRWGFRGLRIERRHFRLDQIQDGGRRPFWRTSNGHNSAMRHPIDFVFGSRLVFLARIA